MTPQSLVNIRPIVSAIRDFFGSSPLSQFHGSGATPLPSLRISAVCPLSAPAVCRETEPPSRLRDVHYTHYGRVCPIETPEGPNIGLISCLATYARVNKYGFIEAPYRVVENGVVTDEVKYLTADEEDEFTVATASEPLDEAGRFLNRKIAGRHRDEIGEFEAEDIDLMDVSAKMVVSVRNGNDPLP